MLIVFGILSVCSSKKIHTVQSKLTVDLHVFLERKTEKAEEAQHEMQNEKLLLRDENLLILIIWTEKNWLKRQKKFIAGKSGFWKLIRNCQWSNAGNNWIYPTKKLISRIIFCWLNKVIVMYQGYEHFISEFTAVKLIIYILIWTLEKSFSLWREFKLLYVLWSRSVIGWRYQTRYSIGQGHHLASINLKRSLVTYSTMKLFEFNLTMITAYAAYDMLY